MFRGVCVEPSRIARSQDLQVQSRLTRHRFELRVAYSILDS